MCSRRLLVRRRWTSASRHRMSPISRRRSSLFRIPVVAASSTSARSRLPTASDLSIESIRHRMSSHERWSGMPAIGQIGTRGTERDKSVEQIANQ